MDASCGNVPDGLERISELIVIAVAMLSHQLLRWAVPFFLITALLSSMMLLGSLWFRVFAGVQIAFYVIAWLAFAGWSVVRQSLPGKVALYFTMVNAAILVAWLKYVTGVRQELWTPSQR